MVGLYSIGGHIDLKFYPNKTLPGPTHLGQPLVFLIGSLISHPHHSGPNQHSNEPSRLLFLAKWKLQPLEICQS